MKEIDGEIRNLISDLTPEDVGTETVGDKVICFEGFTDACWVAHYQLKEKGIGGTLEETESDILRIWNERFGTPTETGWQRGGIEGEPDVFYAIYPSQIKPAQQK